MIYITGIEATAGTCRDSNGRKQFQCKLVYIRPDLLRRDHLDRRFGSNPKDKRRGVLSQELLKNRKKLKRTLSSSRKMMKSMLFVILVYSNSQAAPAMERALQQLVELQGRNMETVQAFMQRVTDSSSASSQQTSALSQATTDFGRIMHDTQTKTLSGIETALESVFQSCWCG